MPQLIPAGALVSVPVPDPVSETLSVTSRANDALTLRTPFIVMVHVPTPAHSGMPQPANREPGSGRAVSATVTPLLRLATQIGPQLMPPRSLTTTPAPEPALCTVSVSPNETM